MNSQQRSDKDCDTMPLKDYEILVENETKHVEAKVTSVFTLNTTTNQFTR